MKTLNIFRPLLILIPISLSLMGNSQNVAINATGNQADPSAMLDVSSQTAGVLIPRMSTASRNAISHPATGLQVFNTDCDELNYWSGTCWVSLGSLPSPYPIISSNSTALCAAVTTTYRVSAVMGATKYYWTVPAGATINSGQGTTSVNVTFGNYSGQICVVASDTCETSNPSCIDINISPIPPTPGNITGLASVDPGQNGVTYFIASVSGAGVYNWSVPSGATIITGVGTPAITVNFSCSAVSGNVSVTAGSNCGTSSPSVQAVTVTPLSINAGPAVFGGTAIGGSPTASGGQTPYTYSWSPNNNLSGYAIANPTALCSGSTTTYTVNVTDFNGCSATSSVVVTRNLTASAGSPVFGGAVIGGNPTATGGQTPYTYSWSPNNNLSGYSVANPTAMCSGSTTTYTVTLTDAHGCTATSSVVVTRNLIASAGSAVFGGAAIGGSPTATGGQTPYTYSWSPNSNLSSYTAANPTALCGGSTTTYTVNVTDANGCTATSSVAVTINLAASASLNTSVCSGNPTPIGGSPTASGGNNGSYSYSWNPAANLSSSTVANPIVTITTTTTYSVTITDANGCTASSSVAIAINTGSHGSQTFSYSGSIVSWTLPSCITTITVQALGAQGGGGINSTVAGGQGASMTGTINLPIGTVLNILVGQMGQSTPNGHNDNGGGGGTYVVEQSGNVPLIIAGGGGGGYSTYYGTNCSINASLGQGQTTTYGATISCYSTGSGGTSGNGGSTGGSYEGGGGGGFYSNGAAGGTHCSTAYGGASYLNGGAGGIGNSCYSNTNGGFGGGGGGCLGTPGGGGGYSGGGTAGDWNTYTMYGGGGGSYIISSATNQSGSAGYQSGNGQVTITY